MAPSPQCSALNSAMQKKGYSYQDIASKIGKSVDHVQAICTGVQTPTQAEFNELAQALGITSPLPHDPAHTGT